ncbi:hypothetical protein [Micromonospora sp. DT233]|uniref:hypothetical protein n=1 Tax=Micromonospora sp. DT233 TaxID=3393432 RepID=UPI003CF8DA17
MIGKVSTDQIPASAPLLRGLAQNPAAPTDVLLRLIHQWPEQACEGLRGRAHLPMPVQDVMARHPSRRVRIALAEHPGVAARTRSGLLDDPQWQVWTRAFGRPGQQPLSDAALVRLLTLLDEPPTGVPFTREELLWELAFAMRHERRLFLLASGHPQPGVRRFAAGALHFLDDPTRETLLGDPVPEVRAAAAQAQAEQRRLMQPADLPSTHCHAFWSVLQRPLSRALVDQVLASGDVEAVCFVATNASTPPDVVETLLGHPAADVRRKLATRPDLTGAQALRLAADPTAEVRTAVSVHPHLTEQQRAGIDIDLATVAGAGHYGPRDGCSLSVQHAPDESVPPLADALRWARSVNPLLRRRAARHPQLPTPLVAALAEDSDLGTRVLLAQHHPKAPPALLARCFLEYDGCGRDRLTSLPNFPVAGLARFATHPDPAVRHLVALDPHADPQLVDHLSADPDTAVRQAMAGCRRLPRKRIIALLDDPDLAFYAAANPALPVRQMHRILRDAS